MRRFCAQNKGSRKCKCDRSKPESDLRIASEFYTLQVQFAWAQVAANILFPSVLGGGACPLNHRLRIWRKTFIHSILLPQPFTHPPGAHSKSNVLITLFKRGCVHVCVRARVMICQLSFLRTQDALNES